MDLSAGTAGALVACAGEQSRFRSRWGFLEEPLDGTLTVTDVLARGEADHGRAVADGNRGSFITVDMTATVAQALEAAGVPVTGDGAVAAHAAASAAGLVPLGGDG